MNEPAPRTKRGPTLFGNLIDSSAAKTSAKAKAGGKKCHSHKPLPKQFRRDRFTYWQIYRDGDFAIYRQSWKGNEHSAAFEVIRIRRREGFEIDGRFVEPAEVYPNSEAWGSDGFTVTDEDLAFTKFRKLA